MFVNFVKRQRNSSSLQIWLRRLGKCFPIAYLPVALLPAVWALSYPTPVVWLRPICKDTWPILAAAAMAAILPRFFRRAGASAWSLLVIALTQAAFQAWCYNTASHPAGNPFQMWGILPTTDSGLYYSAAHNLLDGQKITAMAGARQTYPIFLATLLKLFRHDFRWVMSTLTIVMALATWSAFEVIRCRLTALTATVYLACVTFYIRIHCTGVFMTEQLGLIYSLCAVAMLIESLAREGRAKTWLYCGGLFFITQALNARPAAYMTLPFLVLASWKVFEDGITARGRIVVLSSVAVAASILLHGMSYYRAVASRAPSNAWFCVYGLLNNGTWVDGRNHTEKLLRNTPGSVSVDRQQALLVYAQGLRMLREECLAEMNQHPARLLRGWWRALRFLWSKNTPFRSAYPQMPSIWFTESARFATILGLAFSVFLLLRGARVDPLLKRYQALSWLNLGTLLGMIISLPFAPPWDGETRIYAATLALFFLLPAFGLGGLYLLILIKFHEVSLESKIDTQPKLAIGSAVAVGGALSIVISLAPWCLIGTGSAAKNGPHPVESMVDQLNVGGSSVSSFDLRSLKAGYHLHVIDDTQRTWLPNISRRDFIRNLPGGIYSSLSPTLKQLPPGTELVVLPYWVLLVLDNEDARAQRFTPLPEQTGHVVWPPVYFSRSIPLEGR
jgi:hypothetical protein